MTKPNFKDLTGKKFGKLTVIERVENNIYGSAKWLCKCDCGGTRITLGSYLFRGLITHCGCENRNRSSAFKDMTGQRIGKLIVIKRAHNDTNNRAQWLCKCQCGKEIIAKGNDLRNNRVTCCNTCKKESEQE